MSLFDLEPAAMEAAALSLETMARDLRRAARDKWRAQPPAPPAPRANWHKEHKARAMACAREFNREIAAGNVPDPLELAAPHDVTVKGLDSALAILRPHLQRAAKLKRQAEIARLARAGMTDREISHALCLHPKSVGRLRRAALAPLQQQHRAQGDRPAD